MNVVAFVEEALEPLVTAIVLLPAAARVKFAFVLFAVPFVGSVALESEEE